MAILNKLNLKLALLALVLVGLQTALFSGFTWLNFNLALAFIFVSSSLLPLYENLIVASLLCIFSSLLIYDMSIFLTYPILAFVASKLNPSQIGNKLIVCIAFNIVFTPIFELIYNRGNFDLMQNTKALLANLIVSLILFLLSKLILKVKTW